MPKYKVCAVLGCTPGCWNPSKMYTFPKKNELRKKWTKLCCFKPLNLDNARVCGRHFSAAQKSRNLKHELLNYKPSRYRDLKQDALPDLNLPQSNYLTQGEDNVEEDKCSPSSQVAEEPITKWIYQIQQRPRLTVAKTLAELPTSTISSQQHTDLSTAIQTSIITSSLQQQQQQQQQPMLTVVLPKTSGAVVTSNNFTSSQSLQNSSFTVASTVIPSTQQKSMLELSNPSLPNYLTFVQQQPMVGITVSQTSAGQNFGLFPSLSLSSVCPTKFVPALKSVLEYDKEPEFVEVKEESQDFCTNNSHDNIVNRKKIFNSCFTSATKEEPEEFCPGVDIDSVLNHSLQVPSTVFSCDKVKNNDAFTMLNTAEDLTQRSFGNLNHQPSGGDELGNGLIFPHLEVKVELEEGHEDIGQLTDHPLGS